MKKKTSRAIMIQTFCRAFDRYGVFLAAIFSVWAGCSSSPFKNFGIVIAIYFLTDAAANWYVEKKSGQPFQN